jgi:leucyl aminopeptidase
MWRLPMHKGYRRLLDSKVGGGLESSGRRSGGGSARPPNPPSTPPRTHTHTRTRPRPRPAGDGTPDTLPPCTQIADIGSVSSDASGQGGAIVAALFLREFVAAGFRDNREGGGGGATSSGTSSDGSGGAGAAAAGGGKEAPLPWVHIDTGAWVGSARAGRPDGGEALGLLALAAMLEARYRGGRRSGGGAV